MSIMKIEEHQGRARSHKIRGGKSYVNFLFLMERSKDHDKKPCSAICTDVTRSISDTYSKSTICL